MEIISNGNVGIGTSTNPQEKLHVKNGNILVEQDNFFARLKLQSNDPAGEAIFELQSDNDEPARVYFGDQDNGYMGRIEYHNSADYMKIFTNGTEQLRIDNNGNLLVGGTGGFQILNGDSLIHYDYTDGLTNGWVTCFYVEGNNIMSGDVNVIVTDGFTGNIALKTAEGTANFITSELKKILTNTILGKISTLLNIKNLNKFKKKLDPRNYNGAIFIGLKSPVVKSHGSTDYIGFSNSLSVCEKIIKGNLINKIKENIQK